MPSPNISQKHSYIYQEAKLTRYKNEQNRRGTGFVLFVDLIGYEPITKRLGI